jgi:hypothetical protein
MRWVNVSAGHTISWSIQPHKKSINFGIFKHPGAAGGTTPHLPSSATIEGPGTPALELPDARGRTRNDKTVVLEKLSALGLKQVQWAGKCEADKVSMGTYDVPAGEGGMYGLVFDNTFSKTVSKTATFVLMTYPSNAPPKSGHHMHYAQTMAGASSTSLGKSSPGWGRSSPRNRYILIPSRSMLPKDRNRRTHSRRHQRPIAPFLRAFCRRRGGKGTRDTRGDSSHSISRHQRCRTIETTIPQPCEGLSLCHWPPSGRTRRRERYP